MARAGRPAGEQRVAGRHTTTMQAHSTRLTAATHHGELHHLCVRGGGLVVGGTGGVEIGRGSSGGEGTQALPTALAPATPPPPSAPSPRAPRGLRLAAPWPRRRRRTRPTRCRRCPCSRARDRYGPGGEGREGKGQGAAVAWRRRRASSRAAPPAAACRLPGTHSLRPHQLTRGERQRG